MGADMDEAWHEIAVQRERLLRELESTTDIAVARLVIDLLVEPHYALEHAGASLAERFRAACRRWSFDAPPVRQSALAIGETWLLLAESGGHGHVVRARLVDCRPQRLAFGRELARADEALARTASRALRKWDHEDVFVEMDRLLHAKGKSAGLGLAVALLSRRLGVAPPADVAASAGVDERGCLTPVEHLGAKLDALAKERPLVRRLVVASGQAIDEHRARRLEVVRHEHLAEALPEFALDLIRLASASLSVQLHHLHGELRRQKEQGHGPARSRQLAAETSAIADALGSGCQDDEHASALLLAADFYESAGEAERAQSLVGTIPEGFARGSSVDAVRRSISRAAIEIDIDPEQAVAWAEQAIAGCERLEETPRRKWLGRSLGTLGRARLHHGQPALAEPWLRKALAHYELHEPWEAARSGCYLATCLRHLDRPEESLAVIGAALRSAAAHAPHREECLVTAKYLLLERGRTFTRLERWGDAAQDFEKLADAADLEEAHELRVGASRGLAQAWRRLGSLERSRAALEHCLQVAADEAGLIGRLSALAAGEALIDERPCGVERGLLDAIWRKAWGDPSPAAIGRVLAAQVY